jgi:acyl-CoA synthetase (NDP forming)
VVDLALIAVPQEGVMAAVESCAAKGVKVATIFSANFAEADAAGAALQHRITDYAAEHGLRILGPNCIGSSNRSTGATGTFAASAGAVRPEFHWDKVAFVSQSGAIAAHCVFAAFERGLDFDPWISTGNESDIEFADVLAQLAMDDEVTVIAAYLEGCRNGEKLREALAIAKARNKPVVLLKAGRSEVGAKAAASHTASLVGSEDIFDALFRQYNVCRVETIAELIDLSYAFSLGNPPAGSRIGLLTGSGGVGIIMADAAETAGLEVPPLSDGAQRTLKELWPPSGVGNPIDTTAQVMNDPKLLTAFLETVLEDDFDMVMVFLTYMGTLQPWADNIVAALRDARAAHPEAVIALSLLATPEIRAQLEQLGMPAFVDPAIGLNTLARVAAVTAGFRTQRQELRMPATVPPLAGKGAINEVDAKLMLAAAGIAVVEERVVGSSAEAGTVSAELGYPVVMKIVSPQILHKTEVGGVRLDIRTPEDAALAFEEIVASASSAVPDATIDGVLIAPMIEDGIETILGVQNDPTFGPTVMFGLGGVFVEVLKDVTYRLAPFDVETAAEMVQEIKGFPLLDGARGSVPGDLDALCAALSALSVFAAEHRDSIDSVDINPFFVRPSGKGAVAVDALIVRKD